MARKKKKGGLPLKKRFANAIINIYKQNPNTQFNYKQLAARMEVRDSSERKLINELLMELEDDGVLKHVERGKYKLLATFDDEVVGRISFTLRRAAYVIVEGMEQDVYIHNSKTGKAFNNDEVRIKLFKRGGKLEGEVIEIVSRAKREFVGTVDRSASSVFVRPDDKYMPVDFFIEKGHLKGAIHGEKVVVKFLTWPSKAKSPLAAVIERIGQPGSMDTEMNSILAEYGFPLKFPEIVERAASSIKEPDYDHEAKSRRDFREILTFTIDPHDAKDFDDALSYRELENGNIEVGVHIADVSHYVNPETNLDKEAYLRGNSVYLVDRVIPMLPEVLSNQLCSLRPNETKLTFSAVFELDKKAKVLNRWFGKTVILSDKRFTYEQAQEIIEGKDEDGYDEVIRTMDGLAKILRKNRLSKGALDIESQEVRFKLDEVGRPLGIVLKESKDANKLIEEFMLLANREVASFIGKPEKNKKIIPFVYRVHNEPDEDRISDLKIFLDQFGYSIEREKGKPISYSLNNTMDVAKEKDELHIIGPMIIRSMSKAIYDVQNIGHYGLAFEYYTHFTSPIRRYADLLVHRILFEKLNNRTYPNNKKLDDQCKHISETEKQAVEAERASTKFMQVKYMSNKVGQSFLGKITGVTDWGIFVELNETKCEGLVHISTIEPGDFFLNDKTKKLESYGSDVTFHLGQEVEVKVTNTDIFKKQIDLKLVEN